MIKLQYQQGGVTKYLELMVDSIGELRPVFVRFSPYMRAEIDAVFSSGGQGAWPERAQGGDERQQSTAAARIEKIKATQYDSLAGAIRSSQRKVQRKIDRTPFSESKITQRQRKSVARYDEQLAELVRVAAGGPRNPTAHKVLYERIGRREQRAEKKIAAIESGQLLGRVANSFGITITKDGWAMFSSIPWAGAQNEGATVGHGARLPARTFLEWTPERITKFVELVQEHMLAKKDKAEKR